MQTSIIISFVFHRKKVVILERREGEFNEDRLSESVHGATKVFLTKIWHKKVHASLNNFCSRCILPLAKESPGYRNNSPHSLVKSKFSN